MVLHRSAKNLQVKRYEKYDFIFERACKVIIWESNYGELFSDIFI